VAQQRKVDARLEPSAYVAIAEFMHNMHAEIGSDGAAVWSAITTAAPSFLPAVGHASITVVENQETVRSRASSDGDAMALDEIQQRCFQGPAVESASERQLQRVDDLDCETRWPQFIANAVGATPIRSILSFPLFSRQDCSAVLNLYTDQPDAFGTEAEELGSIFALNAAVLVETGRREKQFHHALTKRDVIGQAKGMLMERFDIDAATAFALLIELSNERHQSVPSIARYMVRKKGANAPAARQAWR
jgi:hypothetical protein